MRNLLNLVLENSCSLCQRSTAGPFCRDCQRQLQSCQLPPVNQFQIGPPLVFAWGHYTQSLKRAIAAFKYENQPHLSHPLGQWMAQSWRAQSGLAIPQRVTVVPIPLHVSKQQQRGFNQAALLAKRFCTIAHLPLALQGLERSRATEAQFGLDRAARDRNLDTAFTVGQPFLRQPPAHPVLLLDDIYTTGATARSATQTLRRQGIRVCGIAVLARTGFETQTGFES